MEITKIVVIVILALLVVIEALIIWALSERNENDVSLHDQIEVWKGVYHQQVQESQKWKNTYEKEKRQSDHKDRIIQSMYRGEMIKKLKEVATKVE